MENKATVLDDDSFAARLNWLPENLKLLLHLVLFSPRQIFYQLACSNLSPM